MSKRGYTRRKRRQQNMVLRTRGKFKINHNNPSGRTGMVQAKRTPGKRG